MILGPTNLRLHVGFPVTHESLESAVDQAVLAELIELSQFHEETKFFDERYVFHTIIQNRGDRYDYGHGYKLQLQRVSTALKTLTEKELVVTIEILNETNTPHARGYRANLDNRSAMREYLSPNTNLWKYWHQKWGNQFISNE